MPLTRAVQYVNYATTALTNSILSTDLTIEVDDPSVLPVIGPGEHFYIVLKPEGINLIREILRATDVTGSIVTVDRGVDDTIPLDFNAEAPVQLWFVKIILDDIREDINSCLDSVETDIDSTTGIIGSNTTEISRLEGQSDINAEAAALNTVAITGLSEDITDLRFQDMTDVTVAGSAAFLAAQGSGASGANPMIKRSDISPDEFGTTFFRRRVLNADWTVLTPTTFEITINVDGLVDGNYLLEGTIAMGDTTTIPGPPTMNQTFDLTIDPPGVPDKSYRKFTPGQASLNSWFAQYLAPFTISGSTDVDVLFEVTIDPAAFTGSAIRTLDIFAVRVS